MKYKIPFIKPNFPKAEDLIKDYEDIVASNWFTNFGPYEQEFSLASSRYIGSNVYATSISNCTLALEAAVGILLNRDKKKVIMPSFTFAAGAESILRNGFEPIFIDIELNSLQPDIDQARQLLVSRQQDIAGILLCNIFGVGNGDIDKWDELSKEYNLPLIIDSAAGFGSSYREGLKVGSMGSCELFSMHATKPFAVGEGGMVLSRDELFIEKVRSWQNFGFEGDRNIHRIGTNAKMQEINAAIGLHQLKEFDDRLISRRATLTKYKEILGDSVLFQQNDGMSTVPFASILVSDASMRTKALGKLLSVGIEARNYYSPLHQQDILREYIDESIKLGITDDVSSRIISLPVHDYMTDSDIEYITKNLKETLV